MQGIPLGRVSWKKPDVSLRHRMGSTDRCPTTTKIHWPLTCCSVATATGLCGTIGLDIPGQTPESSRILLSVQCVVWGLGS